MPSFPYLQRLQLIQTIWMHTTKHRSRHRRHEERHGNLKWKGVIETMMPRLQSVLLSDFDILIEFPYTSVQADLPVSELFFIACHHSDSGLAW